MAGIFQGLELGKRALLSHQYDLTTIGHNIANANTPGYTRQRVDLTATAPYSNAIGQFGTGVRIGNVRQVRDLFLTAQYRQGNDQLGRWSQLDRTMKEVENIFLEPSENGLNVVMNKFFDSWQTLSQNPESSAARATVREQASLVTNAFRQLHGRLQDLQRSLNQEVEGRVEKINRIASHLARINNEVARQELTGESANDLRDRRDLLIDELSQYVNVTTLEESNGVTRVFIGAMELVENANWSPLTTATSGAGTQVRTSLVWQGSGSEVSFTGGELAGLIEARDTLVPDFVGQLDELAQTFVAQVNALHSTGYGLNGSTGNDFFNPNPSNAANMTLATNIINDLGNIAASQSGGPGDNANSVAIANLQNSLVFNNGTATFNEFYAEIVGTVGVRAMEATDGATNADLILKQVEFSRQSVQGVSLDEEMASLIKAQHAYDAAARIITTVDRALDTLINKMGIG